MRGVIEALDVRLARVLAGRDPAGYAEYIYAAELERRDQERELYEGSLLEFFKRAWREIDTKPLVMNWHIERVAEALERVMYGEIRDLIINLPPRHGKSLLVSVVFPAWVWCRSERTALSGPQTSFLCVSYAAKLAESNALRMLWLVQGAWYQSLWGDKVQIRQDQSSRTDFGNLRGGERYSASIEGGLIGRGGDYQLVDDPHTVAGAESEAERERTMLAFTESLPTRIKDPQTSARILIMQRLHECLLPETQVWTTRGFVGASELRVGEEVYTSGGRRQITTYSGRRYKGFAIGVTAHGCNDIFWGTSNHPVLTKGGWKQLSELTKEDLLVIKMPLFETISLNDLKRLWPIYRERHPPKLIFTITGERLPLAWKDELRSLVARGLNDGEIAREMGLANRQLVQQYRALLGLSSPEKEALQLRAEVLTDWGFWIIVGYWLAEGSLSRDRGGKLQASIWTFGPSEQEYIGDIKCFFEKYGLRPKVSVRADSIQIRVTSHQLAEFFAYFGEGACNKYFPEWALSLPEKALKRLIKGYWRGDGSANRRLRGASINTSSQRLAIGLRLAFFRLGAVAKIYRQPIGAASIIKTGSRAGYVIRPQAEGFLVRVEYDQVRWLDAAASGSVRPLLNDHRASIKRRRQEIVKMYGQGKTFAELAVYYGVSGGFIRKEYNKERSGYQRDGRRKTWIENGCIIAKIRNIQSRPYEGPVYDIETPTQDFLSAGLMSHNSDATGYALGSWNNPTHLMYPAHFDPGRASEGDPRKAAGELIWPELWDEAAYDRLKLSVYARAGQLEQQPAPRGGAIFKRDWLEPWPPLEPDGSRLCDAWIKRNERGQLVIQYPQLEYVVAWVDSAFTDKRENDPCGMVVLGVWRSEGKGRIERRGDGTYVRMPDEIGYPKVIVLHGWEKWLTMHGPPDEVPPGIEREDWLKSAYFEQRSEQWGLVEWVVHTCNRYKVDHLGIETQGGGLTLAQEIHRLHQGHDWGVEVVPAKHDKVARAYAEVHIWSNRQFYVPTFADGTYPTWLTPLVDQWAIFPKSKTKGATDAMTGCLAHLRQIGLLERKEEWAAAEDELRDYERYRPVGLPYPV